MVKRWNQTHLHDAICDPFGVELGQEEGLADPELVSFEGLSINKIG